LVGSAIWLQAASGTAGAAGFVSLAPWLATRVFHVPAALTAESACLLRVAGVVAAGGARFGTLFGVLEAAQRFDRTSAIRLPAGCATFLIP
jgi:hypothetical protein